MTPLVTTEWLAQELGANDLKIVDATWHLPTSGRNARAEFDAAHIPGAVFFDHDDIADSNTSLPNMLPAPEKFASRMQALGLGDGVRVVVYDNSDSRTAARAWWMFKVFGQHSVAILDGGLQKWQAEGRGLESGKPVLRHRHYTVWMDKAGVRTLDDMKRNIASKTELVLDARSAGRFAGTDPEPRAGQRSGHIPASVNLPSGLLFNEDGTYKTGDALKAVFAAAGVDFTRPVVTTCGSGMTAATLNFGLHLVGFDKTALYDGAWAEWGAQSDTPVVTGA